MRYSLFSMFVAIKIVLEQVHAFRRNSFPVFRSLTHTIRQSLTQGQECTVVIEDLTNLGLGIGRKELPDGSKCVIMVPLVLPGEEVAVRVTDVKGSYCVAEVVEVLRPSIDRVLPSCPYFSVCGGCQYQHMNISAQRTWKQSQVRTSLHRIGGFEGVAVNSVVGDDHWFGYRSKLTPHIQTHSINSLKPMIGLNKRLTNDLVEIERCMIASDNVNKAYTGYKKSVTKSPTKTSSKRSTGTFQPQGSLLSILFREADDGVVVTDPKQEITSIVDGLQFRYRAGDFFQTNAFVLPLLVRHVVRQAVGDDTNGNGNDNGTTAATHHLVDAYCGSGLFALSAAPHFVSVHGVELSADAVKAAVANARCNNITNAHFVAGKAERIFASIQRLPREKTVVIIDPPRSGCDQAFLEQLFQFHPKRLVYVSCDPATQARDAKKITAAGYDIMDVTPFDLFPQTRHIESVITFVR